MSLEELHYQLTAPCLLPLSHSHPCLQLPPWTLPLKSPGPGRRKQGGRSLRAHLHIALLYPHPWVLQRSPWAEQWNSTSHPVHRQQERLAPSRGAARKEVGSSHSARPRVLQAPRHSHKGLSLEHDPSGTISINLAETPILSLLLLFPCLLSHYWSACCLHQVRDPKGF